MAGEHIALDADGIARIVRRVASEIIERTRGTPRLGLIGIRRGGVPIAARIAAEIGRAEGRVVPTGAIDITLYRDDAALALPDPKVGPSEIDFAIDGWDVVLVDDVLHTGRTVRAAIDHLLDYGRPRRIWLAALCDRGGRELPIAPDFVGRAVEVPEGSVLDVLAGGGPDDRAVIPACDEPVHPARGYAVSAGFRHDHLLGIAQLSAEDVTEILDAAEAFIEVSRRPVRKVPTLRGKTVVNLFFEASTRTRTSFELAGKRLSADVVNISSSGSSVSKGESLLDTCKTVGAMRPDIVVIRHSASGAPEFVAQRVGCSVVNGGDGAHEHPTQALLDAFAIRHTFGTLKGLKVVIVGDVSHSRVARSNAALLNLFGSEVRFCAPHTLMPAGVRSLGVKVFHRLDEALRGADVIMLLRIQRERLEGPLLPSLREYSRTFGVAQRHLELASERAIVMHPGPMNRGVEIHPALADGERSVILDQVEAGVAVRMAVLYLLAKEIGAKTPAQAAKEG